MRILLILPAAEHVRVTATSAPVPRRNMLRFSLLPLTIVAALTPPEHEVSLCDENVQPVDLDADVDIVAITFMTALATRAYELAAAFRARGRIVIAGGYHPTLCPDEAAAHFDAVVAGEAEVHWPQVLKDIAAGTLQKVYRSPCPADLGTTPIPRRDLTAAHAGHYVTTHAVQTGRGCPHHCRYCSIAAFHQRGHRSRPLNNVIEEIRTLGTRYFMFVDDNIIADPDYAIQLFEALIPLRTRWVSQCSLKIADDPELLRLAYAAGCRGLFIGIETLDQTNLAALDKGFNDSRRYAERIATIRRHGIGVQASVMVGLDNDDVTVFQRTLRFLQHVGAGALQLNILTPLPGTPLFDDFERAGRITDRDWSHYDFRHCVIRPTRMTARQLQDGADWLYRQFYRLDRIVLRTLRALLRFGPLTAYMLLRLNLTYRYDNIRERIIGRNPAADEPDTGGSLRLATSGMR